MTEEWENPIQLENPRRHHSLAFSDDHFYIVGGFGRHRVILDTLDCFKEDTKSINPCASLPSPIFSMATFCYQDKLYALKNQFNSLVYNPANEQWTEAFPHIQFPAGVEFNFAMPYKDNVYLTTRHNDNSKLYSFALSANEESDPATKLTLIGEFQQ